MQHPRRICFVIGTRPEAIKCWPLILELRRREGFDVQVLLTGQHRELLQQMVRQLEIPVTKDLDLMTPEQSLEALTARLIEGVGAALSELRPDCVIVQGDTTTVFVGALAAFYAGVTIAHLEAGLRSGDVQHPFPEEMNRRLTAVLARLHFAPTPSARSALLREGVPDRAIHVTGNTGIDALRVMLDQLDRHPPDEPLARALDGGGRVIAVTVHRRENQPFMRGIAAAFDDILVRYPDVRIVFPVHLSPAVRRAFNDLRDRPRCHLLEPLDYASFVRLLAGCHLVLSDSGGVQEEAPFLGKPVLVVRKTTERPEAVEAGVARLVGERTEDIVAAVSQLLDDDGARAAMARSVSPFGDGYAARRIADILETELTDDRPP